MQEFWINNDDDLQELRSYIEDEQFKIILVDRDEDGNEVIKFGDYKVHVPNQYYSKLEEVEDEPVNEDKYDKLIFGKDQTEHITNITIEDGVAHVYRKDLDPLQIPYNMWAVGSTWADGCSKLKGYQYYKYMRDITQDELELLQIKWNPRVWTPRNPEEGFMLKHGHTYFKDMKVNDVSLLSFDIEATSIPLDAEDTYIPLLGITYRDRDGNYDRKLFDIFDYENDMAMWSDINLYVQEKDPDIILGHNILSYDLPYADDNSDCGLNWGRDGSRIKFNEKKSKYRKNQQQQYDYHDVQIHGRDVIDTMFLSMKWDIGNELPSYGLKAIEDHFEYVENNRTWDWKKWPVRKMIEEKKKDTKIGNDIWEEFRQYCADDTDSPIKIFDKMIPAFFYLTQSIPKTLQQVINQASGSQLDSLMIRSYLQDGYSIPRTSQKEPFEGAISMGIPGLYDNVRKVDVASLYPSIMLQYNIYDKKKDPNRNMLKMLEYFRDERLVNKKKGKAGSVYHAQLDGAQKIVINSMYGFLGAAFLLYNYPAGAAEVTRHGREILLKGVEWAIGHTLKKVVKKVTNEGKENEKEKFEWVIGDKVEGGYNYTLVNVDTDSFSYTDSTRPTDEDYEAQIEELNDLYPDLIRWEKDGKTGIMDRLLVVAAKNYVLVEDGKLKYKGNSLTDQKKEPVLLKFIKEFIDIMLDESDVHHPDTIDLYHKYCKEALDISDINQWTTKKTITKPVLNAKRPNEQKPMDAINEAVDRGVIEGFQEGDKIWIYSAIDGEKQQEVKGELKFNKYTKKVYQELGLEKHEMLDTCEHKDTLFCMGCNPHLYYPKMVPNKINRFPELWTGDHDKWHYVQRIYKSALIFKKLIDMENFPDYSGKKVRNTLESL